MFYLEKYNLKDKVVVINVEHEESDMLVQKHLQNVVPPLFWQIFCQKLKLQRKN